MSNKGLEVLKGTLDMLVLRILQHGPSHGYGITRQLRELTANALRIDEGSMYPALYRMQKRGWIEADWALTETGRRAKVYSLTDSGRTHLEAEQSYWAQFSEAVARVMEPGSEAPAGGS